MRIKNRGVKKTRTEKDFLGEVQVPVEAYYGIQTVRALENFPISGLKEHAAMIKAMALIKKSAARANSDLGRLDKKRAAAIVRACDEIAVGRFDDQFVVDVFQMGAGTSFHMNINEVVANRASEIMVGEKSLNSALLTTTTQNFLAACCGDSIHGDASLVRDGGLRTVSKPNL